VTQTDVRWGLTCTDQLGVDWRDSERGNKSGKNGVKQETMVTPYLGLHREPPPEAFWIVKIHISLFLLSSSLLSSLETLRQHTILLQALSIVHDLSA